MKKRMIGITGVLGVGAVAMAAAFSGPQVSEQQSMSPDRTVVFVRSQQLYYDSVVLGELPPFGPFQILEKINGQLETDYGPGDSLYYGGRWELDMGGQTIFFLCPLQGPGRPNP